MKALPFPFSAISIGLIFFAIIAHRYGIAIGIALFFAWTMILSFFHIEHISLISTGILSIMTYFLVKKVFAKRSIFAFLGLYISLLISWLILDSILIRDFINVTFFYVLISIIVATPLYQFAVRIDQS